MVIIFKSPQKTLQRVYISDLIASVFTYPELAKMTSRHFCLRHAPERAFCKTEVQVFVFGMDFFHFLCIKVMVLVYP